MFKGSLLVSLMLVGLSVADRQIIVFNRESSTVYVGTMGYAGNIAPNNGGFALNVGQKVIMNVPNGWYGRVWGRTGCNFDENGNGPCVTGDCGNKLQCQGDEGVPPATRAEIRLNANGINDFYGVSVIDGYNLHVSIRAVGGRGDGSRFCCSVASCYGINDFCPTQYQMLNEGQIVGCKSACVASGLPKECCATPYDTPETCNGTSTSDYFKKTCHNAYTYAFDKRANTFYCSRGALQVEFN